MMDYESIDAFAQEYVVRVLNSKGVCVWKHSAKFLDCMENDAKYLDSFADKNYTMEVSAPGEPKKVLEITKESLNSNLFA